MILIVYSAAEDSGRLNMILFAHCPAPVLSVLLSQMLCAPSSLCHCLNVGSAHWTSIGRDLVYRRMALRCTIDFKKRGFVEGPEATGSHPQGISVLLCFLNHDVSTFPTCALAMVYHFLPAGQSLELSRSRAGRTSLQVFRYSDGSIDRI